MHYREEAYRSHFVPFIIASFYKCLALRAPDNAVAWSSIFVSEGGARKSVRTPSSNIVEFKMKIKNLFSKVKSDFKEKRYDGLKKGA